MIHSLFVINHSGDVFMEKHWRSIIPRTVMDYFFEAQRQVRIYTVIISNLELASRFFLPSKKNLGGKG